MIESFIPNQDAGLTRSDGIASGAIWIDLNDPTREELAEASAATGADLPTLADMEEIELSSRLYRSGDVVFLTLVLPALTETDEHQVAPVTFALGATQLVTVRYHNPRPFVSYPKRAAHSPYDTTTPQDVLFGLLDEIIDRLADILELTDARIEKVSSGLFGTGGEPLVRDRRSPLATLGQTGALVSDVRNSLVTIERALAFLDRAEAAGSGRKATHALRVLSSDVTSLAEHAGYLTQKLSLLLDTIFGLTTIEQNSATKTFSLVAVLFLPPTLIASIFGMNFAWMPWLDAPWGFAAAIASMVLSSLLSYLFFRWKNLL
ncbi:CorA family divalent cation transporter [Sediminimonas sp.]|uniref:CorA family divalent cation transporter n=1 Tax=Sediminimonas sp. TaxID=2823379 RepID=UPI0025EFD465|nr:CorA family divalent cation transporter [Sediminimonas sp.]